MMGWIPAVICLMISALVSAQDIRLPPTITVSPEYLTYYSVGRHTKLLCEANGIPKPKIEWYKDGALLNLKLSRITQRPNGHLFINPLTIQDNGTYQCFARNPHGRAMSKYARLHSVKLATVEQSVVTKVVFEGYPLKIPCRSAASIPPPAFTWMTARSKTDERPSTLQDSDRINVDQLGNLIFANIKISDGKPQQQLYMCRVFNFMAGAIEQGSYTDIIVNAMRDPPLTAPKLYSPPKNHVVGLVGKPATLQCIFSGNPTPIVTWSSEQNLYSSKRVSIEKTMLVIANLQGEDEGDYVCQGQNSKGKEKVKITLDVQAIPYFVKPTDQPHNINATQGDAVTFRCNPTAEPPANIQWYINGKKINPNRAGPKRKVSADLKRLTIHNVCKTDCGVADLMNVQCVATNIHGSTVTDGYMNVLERTTLTVKPLDSDIQNDGTAQFECAAVSDPATPVEITWFKDDIQIGYVENRIWKDAKTNTLHINATEGKGLGTGRTGNYTCRAFNGYSTAEAKAFLKLPSFPVTMRMKLPSFPVTMLPIISAAVVPLWWTIGVVLLSLILFILLLALAIYLIHNRGESSPAGEKGERRDGNDGNDGSNAQEKSTDPGKHDTQKPNTNRERKRKRKRKGTVV